MPENLPIPDSNIKQLETAQKKLTTTKSKTNDTQEKG
jgi:hypothetical protein